MCLKSSSSSSVAHFGSSRLCGPNANVLATSASSFRYLSEMPRRWHSSNSRWWQQGLLGDTGTRRRPYTQAEWDAWKADQEAKQRLQALQTSLRQCRGSQALPPDDVSALENRIEALKGGSHRCSRRSRNVQRAPNCSSFAGIEKSKMPKGLLP